VACGAEDRGVRVSERASTDEGSEQTSGVASEAAAPVASVWLRALQAAEMVLQEVVQDPVKLQAGRVDEAVEVCGEESRERACTAEDHGVDEVGDEHVGEEEGVVVVEETIALAVVVREHRAAVLGAGARVQDATGVDVMEADTNVAEDAAVSALELVHCMGVFRKRDHLLQVTAPYRGEIGGVMWGVEAA